MFGKSTLKKVGIYFILCFTVFAVNAQQWNTVSTGINNVNGMMTYSLTDVFGGKLYVGQNVVLNGQQNTKVSTWNGTFWTHLPALPNKKFVDIAVNPNGLFISTYENNYIRVYRYQNQSWVQITGVQVSGAGGFLKNVNGEMYLVCGYNAAGSNTHLTKYNPTNNTFDPMPALPTSINDVQSIVYHNNALYISGVAFTSNGGFLYRLDNGTSWVDVAHYYDPGPGVRNGNLFSYNNDLYLVGQFPPFRLHRLGNDTLHTIDSLGYGGYFGQHIEYNGLMYLVTHSSNEPIHVFDGVSLTGISNCPSDVNDINIYQDELYLVSLNSTPFNGTQYNHMYRTGASFSILRGTVFLDDNGNCQLNQGEEGLPNVNFSLDQKYFFNTRANGFYSEVIDSGLYSIDSVMLSNPLYKNVQSNCTLPNQISISGNQPNYFNIPLELSSAFDVGIELTGSRGWRLPLGFFGVCNATFRNFGYQNLSNVQAQIQVPLTLVIDSVFPPPVSSSNNLLTFQINQLNSLSEEKAIIVVHVDPAQNSLGDSVTWHGEIEILPSESDTLDNHVSLGQIIVGAYDPNDKTVSKSQITVHTESVDYHIRFQNTGSDTAHKVIVVDSIDSSLPLSHIVVNSASDPYVFSNLGNALVWEFDNILLPDSTTDEPNSHGFINFTAFLKTTAAVGDTIKNQADIYFDFQPEIRTNTAKCFVYAISIDEFDNRNPVLHVYPNPSSGKVNIENTGTGSLSIKITDIQGRVLDMFLLEEQQKLLYDVSNYPSGTYFLSTKNAVYRIVVIN